jgi:glycosyltransferase involved in cell wall biosynthesis
MDISIIIPAYNRLWALPKAIESCRHTKCNAEIIVVDDGSTDGSWEWLQEQKGIVILKQAHWGKCWAVNSAFAIAKGKYIKFLDSDDRISEGAIDEQFDIAEKSSSDIVVSGYLLKDEKGKLLRQHAWVECDDFIAQLLGECDSSHYSAFLFKKTFIQDIPHRPEYAYRDDRLFVLEAALKHPKVAVHPSTALVHIQHRNPRLQDTRGVFVMVQNFQHVNIYRFIFSQLQQNSELSARRIAASMNVLWPLCHWIAKYNRREAAGLFKWIKQLAPNFEIPDKGVLGLMYNWLGFSTTEQILAGRRHFKKT